MSREYIAHEEEYKGLIIKVYPDEDGGDPRKEWDNFGHMIAFHRNYDLGDKHDFTPEGLTELVKQKDVFALPLYLLDHSGLWIRTEKFREDSGGWDTSHVGFIYCTKEDIREEWKIKHVTKKHITKAYEIMESEVKVYNQYLTGDVYGFVIEEDGEDVDSCWGYYGLDDCIQQAKEAADYVAEEISKREAKKGLFEENVLTA